MASPSNHQREVETDEIPRKHRSGEHEPCKQEHQIAAMVQRLNEHSSTLSQHAVALTDGKIEFASIKKDLALIIQGQMELKQSIAAKPSDVWGKVLDAIIFWAVPIIGGAVLWLIKASGQIPVGVHP